MAPPLWLLVGWSVISACCTATSITNLTFYPLKLTWNDAYVACETFNDHLVQITDEAKYNAVTKLWQSHRKEFTRIGVWIGVIAQVPMDFRLSESCDPVKWAQWDDDEITDKLCVRLRYAGMLFKPFPCGNRRYFMCETKSDEPCPYEVLPNTTVSSSSLVSVLTLNETSMKSCQAICDERIENGRQCWAFHHALPGQCQVFFAKYPIYNTTSSASHNLNIKQCFQGFLSDLSYNPQVPNKSDRPDVCVNLTSPVTEYFHNITYPGPTLNTPSETMISTPLNSITSTEVTASTTEMKSAKNKPRSCHPYGVTEPCYCSCKRGDDAQRVQFVTEIVTNLTINKTDLSSFRRKLISVSDDRPTATGIGYSGLFLLVLPFAVLLISDAMMLFSKAAKPQ